MCVCVSVGIIGKDELITKLKILNTKEQPYMKQIPAIGIKGIFFYYLHNFRVSFEIKVHQVTSMYS